MSLTWINNPISFLISFFVSLDAKLGEYSKLKFHLSLKINLNFQIKLGSSIISADQSLYLSQ